MNEVTPAVAASERKRWRTLGAEDPYWAVCTEERFRAARMSGEDRREFFASGEREVSATFALIARHIDPDFHPGLALDYGCGVGRLTLPIARASHSVIGVDISENMLREARSNASEQGVTNVDFQLPDEALSFDRADLDFVHSYIVFQHIEPHIGVEVTRALLRRLKQGGVGALHYTYSRRSSIMRRVVHTIRRRVPGANVLVNVWQGRRTLEPMIPVHAYDMNRLFTVFHDAGCALLQVVPTDHGGHLGATFFFRKGSLEELTGRR